MRASLSEFPSVRGLLDGSTRGPMRVRVVSVRDLRIENGDLFTACVCRIGDSVSLATPDPNGRRGQVRIFAGEVRLGVFHYEAAERLAGGRELARA